MTDLHVTHDGPINPDELARLVKYWAELRRQSLPEQDCQD